MAMGLITPLLFSCEKKNTTCPKMGYEYVHTAAQGFYFPASDSIPLGDSLFLDAILPKKFSDENSGQFVNNLSPIIEGPLHIVMLYPMVRSAADDFQLTGQVGRVIKDTINFSEGALKGFRTIQWNGNNSDSFKIRIMLKPLNKGVYSFALGQQGYRDSDCALYKYFLKVEMDQHLHYLSEYNNGYVDDYARNFGYCFKVY